MSLLNPGGSRAAPFARIFGYDNIKRSCAQALKRRDHLRSAATSISTGNRNIRNIRTGEPAPHEHKREIARRLRQKAARG